MAGTILRIALGVIPVLTFAMVLLFLDNFKLVKFRAVLEALLVGALVAGGCFCINTLVRGHPFISPVAYARYLAPVIEEVGKAAYLVYLFRRRRVGFMVDAAILGFAIGTGFALVENMVFLKPLVRSSPLIWVIRGFGTAIMHGSTVALMGILTKNITDRRGKERLAYFLPGLVLAITIHSLFNHLNLRPQFLSLMIFVFGLPLLFFLVFKSSERLLRKWLDAGFTSDVELLEMIRTGTVLQSKLGLYLQSLRTRIPGEILADMLCYLRIFSELSIKAKGILLMREAGFTPEPDPEASDKFKELHFLEKSIGPVGKRILAPFLHTSARDLWQLHMVSGKV